MSNDARDDLDRAYDAHRSAVAAVTAYHGGMVGVVPLTDVPQLVLDAAAAHPDYLLLPLCGVASRLAQMAAQAEGVTIDVILARLGTEAALFDS